MVCYSLCAGRLATLDHGSSKAYARFFTSNFSSRKEYTALMRLTRLANRTVDVAVTVKLAYG